MPRLTIRTKLNFAFGLCVGLILIVAGSAYYNTQKMLTEQHGVIDHDVPTKATALELQGKVHEVLSLHRGYMILGLEGLKEDRLNVWEEIDADVVRLTKFVEEENDPALTATMKQLSTTLANFSTNQAKIIAVAHEPENFPAKVHYDTFAAPFGKQIVEHLENILHQERQLEATPERKLLVAQVGEAEAHLLKVSAALIAYLNDGKASTLEHFKTELGECGKSVARLKANVHLLTPSQRDEFDRYLAARDRYIQEGTTVVALRSSPQWNQAEYMCANDVTPLASKADSMLSQIVAHSTQRVTGNIDKLIAIEATLTMTLWIASGIAVFMAVGVAWWLSRTICPPLARAAAVAQQVGAGDLTVRVDAKSNDEIGDLAKGINIMIDKTAEVIGNVLTSANEVASAATEIAASSEEVAGGMNEQSSQITQVSAAVEQMSASVMEVAKKSGDASHSAQQSGEIATQGGKVVEETIQGMTSISEAVSRSAASVQELGKRGEQIGEIIAVINDIADQTNLLALNAAIEAARAGEHGRGFAVVADEVRKLADRTTKATQEIGESITAIQTETQGAVDTMNAGTQQVDVGVTKATQAGDALRQIVASAQDVATMIQSIAASAEQQSAAAEEVSSSVDSISQVTRQASEGTNQAATAAAQLSVKSEQLLQLVRRFKVDQKAIHANAMASTPTATVEAGLSEQELKIREAAKSFKQQAR